MHLTFCQQTLNITFACILSHSVFLHNYPSELIQACNAATACSKKLASGLPWWRWRWWCAGRPSRWGRVELAAWGPPFLPPGGQRLMFQCGPPYSRSPAAWTSLTWPAGTDRWVESGRHDHRDPHTQVQTVPQWEQLWQEAKHKHTYKYTLTQVNTDRIGHYIIFKTNYSSLAAKNTRSGASVKEPSWQNDIFTAGGRSVMLCVQHLKPSGGFSF